MDSLCSISKQVVASFEYGNSVESLIKALQNIQNYVIDTPDYAICLEIDPHTFEKHVAGRLRLIEEKLTDGSFVYNVELFG